MQLRPRENRKEGLSELRKQHARKQGSKADKLQSTVLSLITSTYLYNQEPKGPTWLKAESPRQGLTVSMASILTMFLFLGCWAGPDYAPSCNLAP